MSRNFIWALLLGLASAQAGAVAAPGDAVGLGGASLTLPLGTTGTLNLPLSRSGDNSYAVRVRYHSVDGTAVAGTDYTAASGSVSFPAFGATALDLPVNINAEAGSADKTLQLVIDSAVRETPAPASNFGLGAAQGFSTRALTVRIAAGDADDDGIPDLFTGHLVEVSGDSGDYNVLFGTAAPGAAAASYAAPVKYHLANGGSQEIAAGDLDGDGRADLVAPATGYGNYVAFLFARDSRAFARGCAPIGGTQVAGVALGDFDGDGKLDVVTADPGSGNLSVLINAGATGTDLPIAPDTADTLRPQLQSDPPPPPFPGYSSCAGDGRVVFAPFVEYATPGLSPQSVAVADLNGDGKRDLAATGAEGLAVLLNNGDGTFAPAQLYEGGGTQVVAVPRNGAPADLAVLASPDALIFPNNGSGGFGPPTPVSVGSDAKALAVGDVDGNGLSDLAVVAWGTSASAPQRRTVATNDVPPPPPPPPPPNSGKLRVVLNGGPAGYAAPLGYGTVDDPRSLVLADLNADGALDVAVAHYPNTVTARINTRDLVAIDSATGTGTVHWRDLVPDAFGFTARADVNVSATVCSTGVVISGIDAPAPASVSNGEFRVYDGAAWGAWSTSGSVSGGQRVQVRQTSAATPSTSRDTDLTIGGVTGTFTTTTAASDPVPDAYAFASRSNAKLATLIYSAGAYIAGINTGTAITVSGGEYRLYDGSGWSAWTAAQGTVLPRQRLQLRHVSAATPSTSTRTDVTVGGVAASFTSTTEAPDTAPDSFAFTARTDVTRSTLIYSDSVRVKGINTAASVHVEGGEYRITHPGGGWGPWTGTDGSIDPLQFVQLRHRSAASASTSTTTALAIGGVSAEFTSTTAP